MPTPIDKFEGRQDKTLKIKEAMAERKLAAAMGGENVAAALEKLDKVRRELEDDYPPSDRPGGEPLVGQGSLRAARGGRF